MSQKLYNDKKSLQKSKNMKKDFKQFFIESAGQSLVQQGEFEQISAMGSDSDNKGEDSSDNEFEEEDDQPPGGIKEAQFWNGLKMISNAPPPSKDPVNWKVNCPMTFGFNSLGRDNIFYLDGLICKAAGCLLIYGDKIYPKHSQNITTLSYNINTQQLLSATESSAPQLFLWKFNKQNKQIQWERKFFIGKKCEDIYAISFFKNDFVVAVQKFTFHKSSILHCFDKVSGKKEVSLKVGKFYDLEALRSIENRQSQSEESLEHSQLQEQERLLFANDEGISELIYSETQSSEPFKTKILHQSSSLTCLCPFYENEEESKLQILYGNKEGKVQFAFLKKQLKVHEGWIFQIKHQVCNNSDYFFSLGAIDCNLSVIQYRNKKINILHKIDLGGYGRSIQNQNNLLLIGKRDGNYEEFSIKQLIEQKETTKVVRKQSLSLKCFQSREKCKNFLLSCKDINQKKQRKRYVYGHSGSKNITFFIIQQKKMTDLTPYTLRSYPSTFDIRENLIAYTYDVDSKDDEAIYSKTFPSTDSKILNSKQKQFKKSVLVIEDYVKKTLLTKTSIKIQKNQDQFEKKCTVIKFSVSGKYLALGNEQGNIYLLEVGQKQNSSKFIKSPMKMHKQSITQIIWSLDQKYLKSVSMSQLFFWQISETKEQNGCPIKLNNIKALQVKDINWTSMGKFSWQVKNIWDQTSVFDEIYKFWSLQHTKMEVKQTKSFKEVESSKEQLIGCTTIDGSLRIYNYPANATKFQSIKLSSAYFEVCEFINQNDKFSFLVAAEGILMVIELTK